MFKHRFLVVMKHKLLIFPHSLENISISHTISIRKIGCNVNHCRNQNVCSDTDDRQPRQVTYRRLSRHSLSGPCRSCPIFLEQKCKKEDCNPRAGIYPCPLRCHRRSSCHAISNHQTHRFPAASHFQVIQHQIHQIKGKQDKKPHYHINGSDS